MLWVRNLSSLYEVVDLRDFFAIASGNREAAKWRQDFNPRRKPWGKNKRKQQSHVVAKE